MKIYWLMIIWVICWGMIASFYSKTIYIDETRTEKRVTFMWALVVFSIIIFFIGLRSGIADTWTYINIFESYPISYLEIKETFFNENDRDYGFKLISIIIKVFISDDFHVWLFIIALISGLATMRAIQKYSCNFSLSILLFMLTCQFTWLLNGMRQYIPVSILFMCTGLILKDKKYLYLLLVLLLSTIHASALIVVPAYFVVKEEPWSKKITMLMVLIIVIIILGDRFTNILNVLLEDTSYGEAMKSMSTTDDGTNIIRIMVEAVPVVIAFIYRDKIKKISTPIINLSINMSLISTCLYIISKVAKSGIMLGRLPIYFSLYNLILIPWLIENIFTNKKEKRFIVYSMLILYFLFFWVQMYIAWGGLGYISDILNINT